LNPKVRNKPSAKAGRRGAAWSLLALDLPSDISSGHDEWGMAFKMTMLLLSDAPLP
jgi:hypothetical protein